MGNTFRRKGFVSKNHFGANFKLTTATPSKAKMTVPKKRGKSERLPTAGKSLGELRWVTRYSRMMATAAKYTRLATKASGANTFS